MKFFQLTQLRQVVQKTGERRHPFDNINSFACYFVFFVQTGKKNPDLNAQFYFSVCMYGPAIPPYSL